jgi:hypothetical protein
MHVERRGGPPDLQAAFRHFVVQNLSGRLLDDHKDEEAKLGKFPDFACFRDLILIEMKHLQSEQNSRVNDAYKKTVLRDEEPRFYGQRNIDLDQMSNADEIRSAILNKLAKTIETHLNKANSQFGDYRGRNPRKNSLSVCLLLNSLIDEFSPDVVMHAVHRKMKLVKDEVRFPHIDAILYISEKHFQCLPDGKIAFAVLTVIGMSAIEQSWKMDLIDLVARKWSEFRTGAVPVPGSAEGFQSIDEIPRSMTRSEVWQLAYKRDPYLSAKTDNELKLHFHRSLAVNSLAFIKGGWPKPDQKTIIARIRRFSDTIDEINRRGIDMRQFDRRALTSEECLQVYAGLPEELIEMLRGRPAD